MRYRSIGCGLVLAIVTLAACAAPNDDGTSASSSEVVSAAEGMTNMQAVARAQQWVDAKLQYCWAPNGGNNHAAGNYVCPTICNRMANPDWDPYRSDCSGLVSWAWGLPAPGRTTTSFYPFKKDITQAIQAADLRPGDAINSNSHIMLFKEWVTPGKVAKFLEEPGCGDNLGHAREVTSNVKISGSNITPAGYQTFTAIRYGKLVVDDSTPPPPTPDTSALSGALDAVSCDGIKGWAMSAKNVAVDVELSFFGKRDDATAMTTRTAANVRRSDLPGDQADFGFELDVPLSARDGQPHPVYAYALDASGAAKPLGDAQTITCDPPKLPTTPDQGARRAVSKATLDAWKRTLLADVAKEPSAETDKFDKGPDFPAAPIAVRSDDGSTSIFVVDGDLRRPIQPNELRAWQLVPVVRSADDIGRLTSGPAWPAEPFFFEGDDGQVYALDAKLPPGAATPSPSTMTPTPDDPSSETQGNPASTGDETSATSEEEPVRKRTISSPSAAGCSAHGRSSEANGVGLLAVAALALASRARRRKTRV